MRYHPLEGHNSLVKLAQETFVSKKPLSGEKLLDFISSLQYLERVYRKQVKTISGWFLCLLGLVFIWIWNWQLLLATFAGIGSMVLVYWLQNKSLLVYWRRWQPFITDSHRQLIVAVSSGSTGALGIYLATSMWIESENRWLATGIILQTFATLITLALLIWYIWSDKTLHQDEIRYNQLLADLTHQEILRRIIAIHQLTRLVKKGNLPQDYNIQLVEYYCLMLSQFQEVAVKEALLDSLESLNIEKFINKQHQPLQIPIQFQPSPNPIYRNQCK